MRIKENSEKTMNIKRTSLPKSNNMQTKKTNNNLTTDN